MEFIVNGADSGGLFVTGARACVMQVLGSYVPQGAPVLGLFTPERTGGIHSTC